MATRKPQLEAIVKILNESIPALSFDGLEDFSEDIKRLISRIRGMGSIIPSHKNGLSSILRMMQETSNCYESKATQDLQRAYVLIEEGLGGDV